MNHPKLRSAACQYLYVPRALKLSGLAVLFAAGFLLAAVIATGGRAQGTTTTETTVEITTAPGTTETVERTTTRRVVVHPATTATTTASSNAENGTPTWVWVLVGILALGLVVLLVVLLTGRGGGGVSPEERQRRLEGAVGSWIAQGWAVENQTADSFVLRRGGDLLLVSVDQSGQVSTRPMSAT